MSNRILRRAEISDDRRSSNRLPIEREVRYKVLGGKKTVKQVGMGKTVNMSSGAVLFTTETALPEGERVELASGDGLELRLEERFDHGFMRLAPSGDSAIRPAAFPLLLP